MMRHLSEEEIQDYTLNASSLPKQAADHVQSCKECMTLIRGYQWLFSAVSSQQEPHFDFDVAELVIPELPTPPLKTDKAGNLAIFLPCVLFLTGVGFLVSTFSKELFAGVGNIVIYLVAVGGICLLAAISIELIRDFRRKLHKLDFY